MKKQRPNKPIPDRIDLREQVYNLREVGPIDQVQRALENITTVHGIVNDIDLHLFRVDGPVPLDLSSSRSFAQKTLIPMLDRHPALRGAEVRGTGRNLHAIVWFDEPVIFLDDAERRRWAGIVKVVQAALPIDPDQPGITALTRPVGSINGKTGRPVEILRPGTSVAVAEVVKLSGEMARSPFRTVSSILFGPDRLSPCPVCGAEGSSLAALDHVGRCYGSCGKVKLEQVYDAFLAPRAPANRGGGRGED